MTSFTKKIFYAFCFMLFKSPTFVKESLAYTIAFLWFDLLRIRRKVALDNVQKSFPDWSHKKVVQVARSSLVHMGRTIVDFNTLAWISPKQLSESVDMQNNHLLEEALKNGKGAILLAAHISNGDMGISALSNKGYPIFLISKRFTNVWLDDVWFTVRGRFGTKFIAPRNSSYDILKALKANGVVVFVLDQFMGPPLGVKTTFFGRETGTATGLALFAQKTGTPVLPCYAYLQKNGRYCVRFKPAIPFEDLGDKNKNLQHMTQKYTDSIEEIVREHPEQWMWIHRRWKAFRE